MTSIDFYLKASIPIADVKQYCPFCNRRSHLLVRGKKKVEAVNELFSGHRYEHRQDLPFPEAERDFLVEGYCRECAELYFGRNSKNIKFLREKRKEIIA